MAISLIYSWYRLKYASLLHFTWFNLTFSQPDFMLWFWYVFARLKSWLLQLGMLLGATFCILISHKYLTRNLIQTYRNIKTFLLCKIRVENDFFFSFLSFKKTLIKKEKILLLCRLKLANVIPQITVWEFYFFLLPFLFSPLSLLSIVTVYIHLKWQIQSQITSFLPFRFYFKSSVYFSLKTIEREMI